MIVSYLSSFTSLAVHKNVIKKACILHRDISLLNLLLIIWNGLEAERSLNFLDDLPSETCEQLPPKLWGIPHWGFLTDWGYAVHINTMNHQDSTTTMFAPSPSHHRLLLMSREHHLYALLMSRSGRSRWDTMPRAFQKPRKHWRIYWAELTEIALLHLEMGAANEQRGSWHPAAIG